MYARLMPAQIKLAVDYLYLDPSSEGCIIRVIKDNSDDWVTVAFESPEVSKRIFDQINEKIEELHNTEIEESNTAIWNGFEKANPATYRGEAGNKPGFQLKPE